MSTVCWLRDRSGRKAYVTLPATGTREAVEASVRAALPELLRAEGMTVLGGWGIVDPREGKLPAPLTAAEHAAWVETVGRMQAAGVLVDGKLNVDFGVRRDRKAS